MVMSSTSELLFSSLTPSLENRQAVPLEPMECRAAPDLGFQEDSGLGTIPLHNGRTTMVWGILSSSSRLRRRCLDYRP